MNQRFDVCIIGGGAAALAAAASLDRGIFACIIEKNQILGRKILATGGGRCNLTNAGCPGVSATLDFFASYGLETICDSEGRYYPYSGCASDVVAVLRNAVQAQGCTVLTETAADRIQVLPQGGFRIFARSCPPRGKKARDPEPIEADRVLLAAGGKAAPGFGTVGDGYRLAKQLGHHVTRLFPILTGIECGDLRDLKGIRARGRVTLLEDGKPRAAESGEIQFTEDGLSGICVFNLTPEIRAKAGESPAEAMKRFSLSVDLAPDFTPGQIASRESTFGILNERLSARIGKDQIKDWRLPVRGIKGWDHAQCTAGGVSLDEIDLETMESRLVPGLYFAGEILDIQGPCGGYNLQNAWETGIRAAEAIGRRSGKR